ncbi:MAG: NfeD family protein [Leptonema sp. (in: Bacteria)]|nr:NfeD family protein [Leptonema sp. (in: bacteria)]
MALEPFVPGLIVIFFGFGAVIVSALTYLGILDSLAAQSIVWAISSLFLIIVLRKQVARYFPSLEKKEETADDLVNKVGVTINKIDSQNTDGRVRVSGTTWKAVSMSGEVILPETEIRVVSQDNLILYVEPLKK